MSAFAQNFGTIRGEGAEGFQERSENEETSSLSGCSRHSCYAADVSSSDIGDTISEGGRCTPKTTYEFGYDPDEKARVRPLGIDTFGDTIVGHDDAIHHELHVQDEMKMNLRNYLYSVAGIPGVARPFETVHFVVVQFNTYCADNACSPKYLLPSEFSLCRFNLRHGLDALFNRHGLIDHGVVPTGMRSEAKENAEQQCVPMIGEHARVFDNINDFMNKYYTPAEAFDEICTRVYNYGVKFDAQYWMFCDRENLPLADRCLKYLKLQHSNGASDDHGFRLVPLSFVLLELSDLSMDRYTGKYPILEFEGHAMHVLNRMEFAYEVEIACKWHRLEENADAAFRCSHSRGQRMIYNILQYIRLSCNLPSWPPNFVPPIKDKDLVDHQKKKSLEETITKNLQNLAMDHDNQPARYGNRGRARSTPRPYAQPRRLGGPPHQPPADFEIVLFDEFPPIVHAAMGHGRLVSGAPSSEEDAIGLPAPGRALGRGRARGRGRMDSGTN